MLKSFISIPGMWFKAILNSWPEKSRSFDWHRHDRDKHNLAARIGLGQHVAGRIEGKGGQVPFEQA